MENGERWTVNTCYFKILSFEMIFFFTLNTEHWHFNFPLTSPISNTKTALEFCSIRWFNEHLLNDLFTWFVLLKSDIAFNFRFDEEKKIAYMEFWTICDTFICIFVSSDELHIIRLQEDVTIPKNKLHEDTYIQTPDVCEWWICLRIQCSSIRSRTQCAARDIGHKCEIKTKKMMISFMPNNQIFP